MADDIYPLGQDRGLIPDIINFGLNSLYQHFRAPEPSGSIGGEMRAQDILEKAGSVMARPQLPEWRRDSPLLNTAMGMVDKALSFEPWNQILNINPKQEIDPMAAMTNIGGAENAIFGPIRTRGTKQAVSALWRHNPEDVAAVAADPRTLNITAPKGNVLAKAQQAQNTGWMPEGSAAVFDPTANELRVAPATMQGGHYMAPLDEGLSDLTKALGLELPPSWTKPRIETKSATPIPGLEKGGTTHLPESMGHEVQHFLNRPRLYEQTDQEVADIFLKLSPYLTQHAKQAALEGAERNKNMGVALDEMLAYLSGKSTRNPENENIGRIVHQLLKTRTAEGGNMGARITPESVDAAINFARRMNHPAYSEAATAQWDKLSAAGKLAPREGFYREQTGFNKAFPDNPLFSMRQRTEPASMYDKLPRAGRTFTSAEDISRAKAGEELPALGSAMPDIPRPVSSPGGLDFFENLRAKLGLEPADLGGAAPEFYGKKIPPSSLLESKRGGQALEEMYQSWLKDRPLDAQTISEKYPKDAFMQDIFKDLANATRKFPMEQRHPAEAGLPSGIKRFRWDAREAGPASARFGGQLGAEKTLDVLDHLRSAGMFDPDTLARTLVGRSHPDVRVDPEGLKRIENLMERIQYDPATGATKGNPTRLLESKRGSDALNMVFKDWLDMHNQFAGHPDFTPASSPKDAFMEEVLAALTHATRPRSPAGVVSSQTGARNATGLSGFRRHISPFGEQFTMASKPLPPEQTLDLLEHLREYGMLEPENLIQAMGRQPRAASHTVHPEGLAFIKKLLERTGR